MFVSQSVDRRRSSQLTCGASFFVFWGVFLHLPRPTSTSHGQTQRPLGLVRSLVPRVAQVVCACPASRLPLSRLADSLRPTPPLLVLSAECHSVQQGLQRPEGTGSSLEVPRKVSPKPLHEYLQNAHKAPARPVGCANEQSGEAILPSPTLKSPRELRRAGLGSRPTAWGRV